MTEAGRGKGSTGVTPSLDPTIWELGDCVCDRRGGGGAYGLAGLGTAGGALTDAGRGNGPGGLMVKLGAAFWALGDCVWDRRGGVDLMSLGGSSSKKLPVAGALVPFEGAGML